MESFRAVELAARDSYSRLLAYLAARSHAIAAAEDALADAFHAALATWPRTGVPAKPEAWLLTVAKRKLIDDARHAQVQLAALPALVDAAETATDLMDADQAFPDDRLKLLFICAHPAIDASIRTPLMLQTVLGLSAERIASAFLVKPSAMGQRLSRAKTKIRDAGIAFEVPGERELPGRLDAVLQAIYAAYGTAWDGVSGADSSHQGLAAEAIMLGRLLLRLLPEEPEAQGLLALMLYCESRRDARRTPSGDYVPLSEQEVARWSTPLLREAESLLASAAVSGRVGRFQLEAAIQSAHAQRALSGVTDWEAIALLYEGLVSLTPTIGALVGRAAAVAEARGPEAAWELLAALPPDAVQTYQPFWALSAHLLKRMRRLSEADAAYRRAIGLCEDAAMRAFLQRQSAPTP